jgi:hypothetical protein
VGKDVVKNINKLTVDGRQRSEKSFAVPGW